MGITGVSQGSTGQTGPYNHFSYRTHIALSLDLDFSSDMYLKFGKIQA